MQRGTSKTDSASPHWGMIAHYILAYIFWLLFGLLSFWAIWRVRIVLVEEIFFLRVNPWQLRAIDLWSLWLMGAGWIVGIFLSEGYLRKGAEKGRLFTNAGKLFLIPLLVIALSYLIRAL